MHILPPYQKSRGADWYKGTANAIYQNLNFIERYDPEYVIILSGDHIYKMDYNKMLEFHKEKGADVTIAVLEVTLEEAKRFGILSTDENDKITEFAEKPAKPKSTKASMGIYIFNKDILVNYLKADRGRTRPLCLSVQGILEGCRNYPFSLGGSYGSSWRGSGA